MMRKRKKTRIEDGKNVRRTVLVVSLLTKLRSMTRSKMKMTGRRELRIWVLWTMIEMNWGPLPGTSRGGGVELIFGSKSTLIFQLLLFLVFLTGSSPQMRNNGEHNSEVSLVK